VRGRPNTRNKAVWKLGTQKREGDLGQEGWFPAEGEEASLKSERMNPIRPRYTNASGQAAGSDEIRWPARKKRTDALAGTGRGDWGKRASRELSESRETRDGVRAAKEVASGRGGRKSITCDLPNGSQSSR